MDPTALGLALGILTFVLSYSCFGMGWTFSLPIAVGTTTAMWITQLVPKRRRQPTGLDFQDEAATTAVARWHTASEIARNGNVGDGEVIAWTK